MNVKAPNVGDVMVSRPGRDPLVSGCEFYTHAICVSLDPFVLVSQEGDMMWTCRGIDTVESCGPASEEESAAAFDRYLKRGRWAPPPAPNELRDYWATA